MGGETFRFFWTAKLLKLFPGGGTQKFLKEFFDEWGNLVFWLILKECTNITEIGRANNIGVCVCKFLDHFEVFKILMTSPFNCFTIGYKLI